MEMASKCYQLDLVAQQVCPYAILLQIAMFEDRVIEIVRANKAKIGRRDPRVRDEPEQVQRIEKQIER